MNLTYILDPGRRSLQQMNMLVIIIHASMTITVRRHGMAKQIMELNMLKMEPIYIDWH